MMWGRAGGAVLRTSNAAQTETPGSKAGRTSFMLNYYRV
jgi:hypothetical protein